MSVGFRHKAKQFKVGDYIALKKKEGYIRYIGKREHHHGIWYGVELTKGEGSNDGSEHGTRYFSAKQGRGIFVRLYSIKKHLNDPAKYPCKLDKSPLTGSLPTLPQSTTLSDHAPSSHDSSTAQPSPRSMRTPTPLHVASPRHSHQQQQQPQRAQPPPPSHRHHHHHHGTLPHNPPVAYQRSPRHHGRPKSTRSSHDHQSLKLAAWHKPAPRPKSTRASWASQRHSHGHRSSKQSIHSSHTTQSAPTYFRKSPKSKLKTGNSFNSSMSRSYSAATGLAAPSSPGAVHGNQTGQHMATSNGRRSPKTPSLTPSVMDSPMTTTTPMSPPSMSPRVHSVTFNESAVYNAQTPQSSFKRNPMQPPSVFTPRGHHKNDTVEIIVDDPGCYTPTHFSSTSGQLREQLRRAEVAMDEEEEDEDEDDGYYSDERQLERTTVTTPSFSASRRDRSRPTTRRCHELISPKFFAMNEGEQRGSGDNVILPMDRAATISVTDKIAAVTMAKKRKRKHSKEKKARKRSRSKSKEGKNKEKKKEKEREKERRKSKSKSRARSSNKSKRKHSSNREDLSKEEDENANLLHLQPRSKHDRYGTDITMMDGQDIDLFDDRQHHSGKHRKHKKHKKQKYKEKKSSQREQQQQQEQQVRMQRVDENEDEDDDYYSMSPVTNPNMTNSQKLLEIDRIKHWTVNENKHKRKSRTVDFAQSQQDRDHLAQIMQIREELVSETDPETSEEDDPDIDEQHSEKSRSRKYIQNTEHGNSAKHIHPAQQQQQPQQVVHNITDHEQHHSKKEERELKQKRFQLPPLIRPQSAGKYRFRLHLKNKTNEKTQSLCKQTEQLVIDEDDEMDHEIDNEYALELPYKQKAIPLKLRQSYSINKEEVDNGFGPHLSLQIHDSNEDDANRDAVAVVGPYGQNISHTSSTSNVAHTYEVSDSTTMPRHHHHHHLPQSSELQIEQNKLGLLKKGNAWNLQLAPDTPRDSDSDRVDDVYDNNVLYPNNNKMRKLFLENNDSELKNKLLSHSPSKADDESDKKHRDKKYNAKAAASGSSSSSSSSSSSMSSDDDDDDDDVKVVKKRKRHTGKGGSHDRMGYNIQQNKVTVRDKAKESDDILFISRNNELGKQDVFAMDQMQYDRINAMAMNANGMQFEIEESVIEYHVPSKAKKKKNQNIKINIHINNDIISKKKKSSKKHKQSSNTKGNHIYSHSNGNENIANRIQLKNSATDSPVVIKKKSKRKTKKKSSKRSKHRDRNNDEQDKVNGMNRAYSMDQRHTARRTHRCNEHTTPRPPGHKQKSARSPKRNCACQKHHECEARSPGKKHKSAHKFKKDKKSKQIKFRSKTAKPLTPKTPIPPISSRFKHGQKYDWAELV